MRGVSSRGLRATGAITYAPRDADDHELRARRLVTGDLSRIPAMAQRPPQRRAEDPER
jgi:hypothetical protein